MIYFLNEKAIVIVMLSIMILLNISGCASISGRSKLTLFENTSKYYRTAILRSDFEQAAILSSSTAANDLSDLRNFHVVSYTPKKVEFADNGTKALQTVEIEYYRVDSMRQKVIRDHQEWVYQADKDTWILESGLPHFN